MKAESIMPSWPRFIFRQAGGKVTGLDTDIGYGHNRLTRH